MFGEAMKKKAVYVYIRHYKQQKCQMKLKNEYLKGEERCLGDF